MSKYRSAMEKIEVTPEMEERILKNLGNIRKEEEKSPSRPSHKWIKPASAAAAMVVFTLTVWGSYTLYKNPTKQKHEVSKLADKNQGIKPENKKQPDIISSNASAVGSSENLNSSQSKKRNINSTNNKSINKVPIIQKAQSRTKIIVAPANSNTIYSKNKIKTKDGSNNKAIDNAKQNKISNPVGNAAGNKNISVGANSELAIANPTSTPNKSTTAGINVSSPAPNTPSSTNNNPQKPNDGGNGLLGTANPNTTVEGGKSGDVQTNPPSNTLTVNPITDTNDLTNLKKAIPFELLVPSKLPSEYKIKSTSVIFGNLAQITYSDGTNKIVYRSAQGSEDISGDYNEYTEAYKINVGDYDVTFKGNNSLVNLATWNYNNCSYSISFSSGLAKDVVESIIESLQK